MEVRSSDNPIPASKWIIVKQSIIDKKIMREGIQHCECSENCNENNAPTEDTTSEQKLENKTRLPPAQQKKATSPTENNEKHLTNDESTDGSNAGDSTETRLKATGSERTDSEALPQITASRLIPRQDKTEPGKETKPVVEHDEVSGKVSGNLDKLKNFVTQGKQRLNALSHTVFQKIRRHRDPSSPSRNALPSESEWNTEKEECTDFGSGRDYFLKSFKEYVPENISPAAAAVPYQTSAATSPGQLSVDDPAPVSHKETDHVDDGPRNSTEKYPCENTDSSGVETRDDAPPDEATSSQNVTEKQDEGEDFQIAEPDKSSSSQNCTENQENEGEDLEASVQELQVKDAGTNQQRRAVENVDETADKEDGAPRGEKEPGSISSPATFDQVGAENGLSPTNRNHPRDQEEKAESTTNEPYSIDEKTQSVSPRNNSEPLLSHETGRVVTEVSFTELTLNNGTNQDAPTRIHSRQNPNRERNQASVYLAIHELHASNVPNASNEQNQGAIQRSNSENDLNNGTNLGFQVQINNDSLLNQEIHQEPRGNEHEPPDTSNAEEEEEEPPDILDTGNANSQQEDNNLRAQEPGWNRGTGEVYQPTTIIGVNLRQHTTDSGAIRELESFAGASARQTVRSRSVEVVNLRNGQRVHDRQHDAAQRTGCLREVLELVRLPRPAPLSTNDSSMQAQESENPGDSSLLQLITRFRSQLSPRGHQMCLHCDVRPPDTILLNCHHCVFCRDCARLASYCPLPGCEVATLSFIFLH